MGQRAGLCLGQVPLGGYIYNLDFGKPTGFLSKSMIRDILMYMDRTYRPDEEHNKDADGPGPLLHLKDPVEFQLQARFLPNPVIENYIVILHRKLSLLSVALAAGSHIICFLFFVSFASISSFLIIQDFVAIYIQMRHPSIKKFGDTTIMHIGTMFGDGTNYLNDK
ncbi:hypothetical protein ACJX0J_026535, partial [Zea mays]